MKSDLRDIDVIYVHATDRAVLVRSDEDAPEVWIPLAQVEIEAPDGGHLRRGRPARLTAPESLLVEKGLV